MSKRRGPEAISLSSRLRAVERALERLYLVAQRPSTFAEYDGHLLLAFCLIGTTSNSSSIRQQAIVMGRELARTWRARWPRTRRTLDADNVLQQVIARYAVTRMGIRDERIRLDLRVALAEYTPRELLYFDPANEDAPSDVPEECGCGCMNERGRKRCARCRKQLFPQSKYGVWYYALTNAFFCERQDLPMGVAVADVLKQLPRLRPYPARRIREYSESIYAVTHLIYTLNGYGESRLSPRALPEEFQFLKSAMRWALEQEEPDTIGEIIDSLTAFGVNDADPLIVNGRRFLLDTQRDDGGWGGEDDEYGYFHTIWTAIDGLRDFRWQHAGAAKSGRRGY